MVRFVGGFILTISLLLPAVVGADVYIKTKVTSSGFAGLGGTEGTTETWVSDRMQTEKSKMELSSPLLRKFSGDQSERTITDLNRKVIITVDEKEKTYREMSFEEMFEKLEEVRAEMKKAYGETESGGEASVPKVSEGERPDVKVELVQHDETKKFAGMKARRTTMKMLARGKDQDSGEEITFKVVFDAWLTRDFNAQAEMEEYRKAYADMMGEALTEENVNLSAVFSSAGLTMEQFAEQATKLDGYPMMSTIRFGSVLTPEQRAEMQKAQREMEKPKPKKKSGGFGGFGGLGDKLGDKIKGKIEESVAEKIGGALFGEMIKYDADGDPVFLSVTTEVEKIDIGSVEAKVFQVPDDYTLVE